MKCNATIRFSDTHVVSLNFDEGIVADDIAGVLTIQDGEDTYIFNLVAKDAEDDEPIG